MVPERFHTSIPEADDVLAADRELPQRTNNRWALGIKNIAESYRRGDIEVNVLARIEDDYCLIRAQPIASWKKEEAAYVTVPGNPKIAFAHGHGYQFTVLALIAQPVKGKQYVVLSLVRLKRLDPRAIDFGEQGKPTLDGLAMEEFLVFSDHKGCGCVVNGPVVLGQRPGEMIKAIPLGLNDHSCCNRDLRRNGLRHDDLVKAPFGEEISLSCIGLPGHLRFRFFADYIGLSAHELSDLVLESCDLGISPLKLGEGAVEVGGGHD